jgi:hypothetical protein
VVILFALEPAFRSPNGIQGKSERKHLYLAGNIVYLLPIENPEQMVNMVTKGLGSARDLQALSRLADVTWHLLDPAEVAQASGLSIELQKVWRNRGILPKKVGTRVNYTLFDAAKIAIARMLQASGWPQDDALASADLFKKRFLQLATLNADGVVEVIGSPDFVESFARAWDRDTQLSAALVGGTDGDGTLLISPDGGPVQLAKALPDLDLISSPRRIVAINLAATAQDFANAIGRPVVSVHEKQARSSRIIPIRRIIGNKRSVNTSIS